jgi:F-box interacting protein
MSDYLPDEVVVDILQRLPVKSLLRFRLICRSWNSLITTPAFIDSHLNRSIENNDSNNLPHPLLIVRYCPENPNAEHYKLFRDDEAFEECTELEFPIKSRRINHFLLIGSENGLICFLEQERYILWNPSIRKVVTLPKPCITRKTHGSCWLRQAFGFDPRTNDYKVVRIAYSAFADKVMVEVYSFSTGSWRITSNSVPSLDYVHDTYWLVPKACLKGSVHFAGSTRGNKAVFSFDLRDEVFREMILPDKIGDRRLETDTCVFCVFRDSLALLCYYEHERKKYCSIWVMKEYGLVDSWVKLFTIDIAGGIGKVVGFRMNGHIILETRTKFNWELSSYDPESQQALQLGIRGRLHYFCVDTYKENLVLLNEANNAFSRSRPTKKRKNR